MAEYFAFTKDEMYTWFRWADFTKGQLGSQQQSHSHGPDLQPHCPAVRASQLHSSNPCHSLGRQARGREWLLYTSHCGKHTSSEVAKKTGWLSKSTVRDGLLILLIWWSPSTSFSGLSKWQYIQYAIKV